MKPKHTIDYTQFQGIVLYDIDLNGCLKGVYTDNFTNGDIYNEIARKQTGAVGIEGKYICSYTENGNVLREAILTITKIPGIKGNLKGTYSFDWHDGKKSVYTGIGFQMSKSQVAVYYQKT
jgi:hypothetical protein